MDGDDDENEGEMRMQEREVDIWKGGRLDDGRWKVMVGLGRGVGDGAPWCL